MTEPATLGTVLTGLARGALKRCPNCGRGRLFTAYLKVRPTCEVCGHDNAQYPADDASPFFTILIVGALIAVPLLSFHFIWAMPAALVVVVMLVAVTVFTLGLMPIVKGAVVGMLWSLRKSSSL